nr:hypothetical protein [Tanacetum cinerariifolium]
MTKVIKEEFEKLESLKISYDSFACNTSLEFFHKEFYRMSEMADDLFTYEVEIPELASIPCDFNNEYDSEKQMTHGSDMEFDPSNPRGDDEVKLTDEESYDSNDEDKVEKIFRINTNNKDIPWVHEKPWTDNGVWEEPIPVEHYCEPFSFKSGHSECQTCNWKDDGYCIVWNLPGAYIVGNTLRYQDLEWYKALKDGKLKDEALKNKSIMKGIIDDDDESHNEGWKR